MLCSLCLLGQVPVWFQSWLHRCIGKFLARYWLVKPQMLLKFPIFLVEPYKMGQLFFFFFDGNLQPIPPTKVPGSCPPAAGCGTTHCFARTAGGHIYGWGANACGELGLAGAWAMAHHGPSWRPGYRGRRWLGVSMMGIWYLWWLWSIYLGVSILVYLSWCIYDDLVYL